MSTDTKNIVIVGASSAGATLARTLDKQLPKDYRIVLIDANQFAYYAIAGLRAAVVPGWEDKIFKPLDTFFGPTTRHQVLTNTKVVKLNDRSVTVQANEGSSPQSEIPFEYCILALGSTYGAPMRSLSGSIQHGQDELRELQAKIKQATNIVLIGGGSVGIEFAGEIVAQYPKGKMVTLIHRNKQLLSNAVPSKMADKLLKQLRDAGVDVVLGQTVETSIVDSGKGKVELEGGKVIDADLIFNTTGVKNNTGLIHAAEAEVVNEQGLVKVDPYLRIKGSSEDNFFAGERYFAIGDCAASLGSQTYVKAKNDAECAAKNILATLSNKPLTALKAPMNAMVVPIGPHGGAGSLPFGVVGAWPVSIIKGKNLFVSNFTGLYKYTPDSTAFAIGAIKPGEIIAVAAVVAVAYALVVR